MFLVHFLSLVVSCLSLSLCHCACFRGSHPAATSHRRPSPVPLDHSTRVRALRPRAAPGAVSYGVRPRGWNPGDTVISAFHSIHWKPGKEDKGQKGKKQRRTDWSLTTLTVPSERVTGVGRQEQTLQPELPASFRVAGLSTNVLVCLLGSHTALSYFSFVFSNL